MGRVGSQNLDTRATLDHETKRTTHSSLSIIFHVHHSPSESPSSVMTRTFKDNLRKYLDLKFWTSINALHWMATFHDPSFKQLKFISQNNAIDARFKRNLQSDLDTWMMEELNVVTDRLNARVADAEQDRFEYSFILHCCLLFLLILLCLLSLTVTSSLHVHFQLNTFCQFVLSVWSNHIGHCG